MGKKLLGEILIEEGLLTPAQLNVALREHKRTGELIGQTLHRLGFVTEDAVMRALANQAGIPYTNLENMLIDPSAVRTIPVELARKHKVLPLGITDGTLTVAVSDPHDILILDTLRKITGYQNISRMASNEETLMKAIDMFYGIATTENIIEASIQEAVRSEKSADEPDPPIIRLVNHLIIEAIKKRGTDIHIEPDERISRVRYRIDGVLHAGPVIPKLIHPAVVARVKIMSRMDIAEQRLPQDGGATFSYINRELDLRVSTLPTHYGEKLVIRLLDKESIKLGLDYLGFSEENLKLLRALLQKPYGIILVTGPTGSGKTTTLYSALLELNSLELNISTIEDPIEYKLPLINQVQVNEKAGLTFASALRSFLRQDPDVILIGEIRDRETADMAFRAAMTGHLVFSTLHTNDAVSAIPRLVDIGVPPYLITSSLLGVVAQRLVRKICPDCKVRYTASPEELALMGLPPDREITLFRGKGCENCHSTGYKGRVAITELFEMTPAMRKLIASEISSDMLTKAAIQQGMKTMYQDGMLKVIEGVTTLQEIGRVVLVEEGAVNPAKLGEALPSVPETAPLQHPEAERTLREHSFSSPAPAPYQSLLTALAEDIPGFLSAVVSHSSGKTVSSYSLFDSVSLDNPAPLQSLFSTLHLPSLSEFSLTTSRFYIHIYPLPHKDYYLILASSRATTSSSQLKSTIQKHLTNLTSPVPVP